MSHQDILLPRTGAPLRVFTREQIINEQTLYLATNYNISARARELKVNTSTLEYHLRPVRNNKVRISAKLAALLKAGDAMAAALPKDEAGFALRKEWADARFALTRQHPAS
jgi:hypothetical protein